MSISAGPDVPHDLHVIIEIPCASAPIKYEYDKDHHTLIVDRFWATPMFYPANYGFVPQTLALDGDPVDCLVISPHPIQAGALVRARPIAILHMEDDGGHDSKVLCVPHAKLTRLYDAYHDLADVPTLLKSQIEHFFKHYKDLEEGKWVRLGQWEGKEAACSFIQQAFDRAINA